MITIEVIGAPRLEEALRRLQSKLTSLKSPMGEIGELLTNIAELSFDNEQTPSGEAWHPLKESTKRYKAKHGGSKILQSKDSNTYRSIGAEAGDTYIVAGVNAVSEKNEYEYPMVHQFGSRHVPARSFFPITKEGNLTSGVEEEIYTIFEDYLREFEG